MEQKGLRAGHFLALVGALIAVGSLWRPWYSVRFPPELREMLGAGGPLGSDPGLFGQMARTVAGSIPDQVSVSGWEVLNGADVGITVLAIGVAAVILAASGAISGLRVDAGLAARAASLAGLGVLALAVWHVVHKPVPGQVADWLHVEQGVWMALVGGAAMLGGGLWAGAQPAAGGATARGTGSSGSAPLNTAFPPLTPDLPPVFAEPVGGTAAVSSVPPPSHR
ncbi:MAG TPA: hypothetical protein VFG42_01795 [Baekduia sp.]|uniref:hypothetical protein n=1 Tax=Baekduia sp. TaxID=2600305 RepID=UPI002D774E66|nr:hypothetical protein [Baekduia sp.]HET6505497.1 hypothetical protein [Baekduia sp.]